MELQALAAGSMGGATIALISALGVFFLTQRHQLNQDVLRDARTLRDTRRERLLTGYAQVLFVAWEIRDSASRSAEARIVPETGGFNSAQMDEALNSLNQTCALLTIEGELEVVTKLDNLAKRPLRK